MLITKENFPFTYRSKMLMRANHIQYFYGLILLMKGYNYLCSFKTLQRANTDRLASEPMQSTSDLLELKLSTSIGKPKLNRQA